VKNTVDARLRTAGAVYHQRPATGLAIEVGADETTIRLVTSFQTTKAEVDRFAAH